tara:strand:- start:44 stop:346 length:303 start_codon:yes stop_codon:yes gene_type:complete
MMHVAVVERPTSTHQWMKLSDWDVWKRTVIYTGMKEEVDKLLLAREGTLVAMVVEKIPSTDEEKTQLGNRMRGLGIYMSHRERRLFPYSPEKTERSWEEA